MTDNEIVASIARVLANLMRDDPQLYQLFQSTMQDPRLNHVIREEAEWDD